MSTTRTCTTPLSGWVRYCSFLDNHLQVVRMQGSGQSESNTDQVGDEAAKQKREQIIDDSWLKVTGGLYMIMRRMKRHGHADAAAEMQQIVDMVVEQDLTDPNVCSEIHTKAEDVRWRPIPFNLWWPPNGASEHSG